MPQNLDENTRVNLPISDTVKGIVFVAGLTISGCVQWFGQQSRLQKIEDKLDKHIALYEQKMEVVKSDMADLKADQRILAEKVIYMLRPEEPTIRRRK